MTTRTSGLSIPIPKALVAITTRTFPFMNSSWMRLRSRSGSPAWYPTAGVPIPLISAVSASTALRVEA